MKVLHLISGGDKGGAKTHVFTLLEALTEEIDIRVICFMEGVFYNEIKDMPIPSMLLKQKYRNDLTIIKPLVAHIRKEGYHLIHAHGARANFIAMFLRPFIKIPVITTVHSDYRLDFTDSIYKKYIYTGLNIMALKQLDYYIAVSENFKQMLIERKFPETDIYTVYNTIDFDKVPVFMPREAFYEKHNIDARGKTVVGIVGRFDYVKGNDIFINAAFEVLKKRDDVLFLLVGEGVEEQGLKHQAEKLGIRDKTIFTGFIDDVWSLFNALDIHVISSRSESFPYVMLEGAMMKKATVAANVGGIGDLIKENETGLLAEACNEKQLAEKILKFIENKDLRTALGENLYEYAKNNFSRESMKTRHIHIYEDVIKRRKAENKLFDAALFGYYGYNNSGDDALLKSIVDALRKEKADINLLVLSKRPKETMAEHNVFAVHRYNIFDIVKYLKVSRLLVYGGGTIIQDVTSTRSLLYYIFLLKLSKHFGLKLMLYGNGIGPLMKEKNIQRAKNAIELCDYISLRDPESLAYAKSIGAANQSMHVSVDPVFSLDKGENIDVLATFKAENIDTDKKYFAVSIRQWRFNEADFTGKMAEAIDKISAKYKVYPLYVPMQPSDLVIIKEVMAKSTVQGGFISKVYEISQLMAIFAVTEFAMCMRLHALIYAVSAGVPVIGLIYDPKVKSFIDYIGEETYEDTARLDVARLVAMSGNILENRQAVSQRIQNAAKRLKEISGNDAKEAVRLCR